MGHRLLQKLASLSEVIKIKSSQQIYILLREIFSKNCLSNPQLQKEFVQSSFGGPAVQGLRQCGRICRRSFFGKSEEQDDCKIIGGSKIKIATSYKGKLVVDNEHIAYGEHETYPICCQCEEECNPSILDYYKMTQVPTKAPAPNCCRKFAQVKARKYFLKDLPPCKFEITPPFIPDCTPRKLPFQDFIPPPFPNLESNEQCVDDILVKVQELPKPKPFVPMHQIEKVAKHKLEVERKAKAKLKKIWLARKKLVAQQQGCALVCTCPNPPELPEKNYCDELEAMKKKVEVCPCPLMPKYKVSKKTLEIKEKVEEVNVGPFMPTHTLVEQKLLIEANLVEDSHTPARCTKEDCANCGSPKD